MDNMENRNGGYPMDGGTKVNRSIVDLVGPRWNYEMVVTSIGPEQVPDLKIGHNQKQRCEIGLGLKAKMFHSGMCAHKEIALIVVEWNQVAGEQIRLDHIMCVFEGRSGLFTPQNME